jgi:hypothetical protein
MMRGHYIPFQKSTSQVDANKFSASYEASFSAITASVGEWAFAHSAFNKNEKELK